MMSLTGFQLLCIFWLIQLFHIQDVLATAKPKSCMDYLRYGFQKDGFYRLFDADDAGYTAYCDFSSEPRSAWTLVMSWALKYNSLTAFKHFAFRLNAPVNEDAPNWNVYRLSHKRMTSLKAHSTHWRTTCSFNVHKVDYKDYVRGNFSEFDIMTYTGAGVCKKVEFINIRDNVGAHILVRYWQIDNGGWREILHIDSSTYRPACDFDASTGSVPGEDNFGLYYTINRKFRCTADQLATTQHWFGGYMY